MKPSKAVLRTSHQSRPLIDLPETEVTNDIAEMISTNQPGT